MQIRIRFSKYDRIRFWKIQVIFNGRIQICFFKSSDPDPVVSCISNLEPGKIHPGPQL